MKFYSLYFTLLLTTLMLSDANADVVFKEVPDIPAVKSPLASKVLFNGVAMAGKRIVGVGQRGHIVWSDDQGKNWTQAAVSVSSDLTSVCFSSQYQGWAVGHDGVVLHTADGGTTWNKQFDGRAATELLKRYYSANQQKDLRFNEEIKRLIDKGADKSLLGVWFENDNTGFIVGAFNLIFRTADGGKTWEPWLHKTDNPKGNHLYAINGIGQELFIAGEQGLLMKYDKQSGQFRLINTGYNGTLFGVTGKSGSIIVHGMRGNVYRSTNGGSSWKKIETGIPLSITGSTVTEDGRIVLVNIAGHLLISNDDGASFKLVKSNKTFPSSAIVSSDKQSLILAGLRGMQKQSID